MIRLAFRTIFANNKESLVEISNQVSRLYRERARSQRVVVRESFEVSIPCTQMEFAAILHGLIQPHQASFSTLDAIFFCLGLPTIVTFMDDGSPMQIRVLVDGILWAIPLHVHFARALRHVGLPSRATPPVALLAGALIHVLSIQISHRQRLEFVPVVLKTFAISGVMQGAAFLIRNTLAKAMPFFPEEIWSVVFAMLFDTLIQRLVRFDFLSTVEWVIEKIVKVMFKLIKTELDDLPDSYEVPESLACPICSQVLKNPVAVLGWLMCEQCLERWISIRARHPCTGEPISAELVEQAVLMTLVADKWHKLALSELLE
jgi:hypothetical protein